MTDSGGIIDRSPTLGVFAVGTIAIVGGGVLALPIALYPFGPLLAGVLVVALGLLNIFTIGALATAISRSNAISSGRGRFISLTGEHLGRRAASVSSLIATCLPFLGLVAYTLGVSATMPSLLGGTSALWLGALAVIVIVVTLLQAKRLFFASAMVVSTTNLIVLSLMILLIATRIDVDGLLNAPDISGAGGLRAALGLVFGTILFSFFGHTALFVVARPALRSDPTGRSLRRGAMLAMIAGVMVNTAWVVVCLAVIPASDYASETGTGLGLLTDAIGPEMRILGLIFLILAPGLAAVASTFELSGAVDERLPRLRRLETVLHESSSIEVVDASTGAIIVLSRIGNELIATGHAGRRRGRQLITGTSWNAEQLLHQLGITRRGCWLRLEVLGEVGGGTAVDLETSMTLRELTPERQRHDFIGSGDTDEELRNRVITKCIRQPSTASELAEQLGLTTEQVALIVEDLIGAQRLRSEETVRPDGSDQGEVRYRAALGTRTRAKSAVVASLFSELSNEADDTPANRTEVPGFLNSPVIRRVIITVPTVIAVLLVAVLLSAGIGFAALLSLTAMAAITLLGGVLPILLNLSMRYRAERFVPAGKVFQTPWISRLLFGFFCIICALYATVIYETIINRLVAVAVLGFFIWLYVHSTRNGAFRARSAVSLELNRTGQIHLDVIEAAAARPFRAPAQIGPSDRTLQITIPDGLHSPVLITAIDGETVPARLGTFTASSADGISTTGRLDDTLGTEITLGAGSITITWQLA